MSLVFPEAALWTSMPNVVNPDGCRTPAAARGDRRHVRREAAMLMRCDMSLRGPVASRPSWIVAV